jgi:UDP-N-acetylmuramoyl-L-alanyl-D-glutamate--2,6-diaminopimelate ligase
MILKTDNFSVTDNTLENGDFFLKTSQNSKYITNQKNIITPYKLIQKLNIQTKIIGITGTNGKTTTAFLIGFILDKLGYRVGVQGTEGFYINSKQIDEKTLTTPSILTTISHLYKYKLDFLVMEVSSHAISQKRIEGLNFDCKIFTNISQDHLDYHKSMDEYQRIKESFFQDEGLKIINGDENINFNKLNSFIYSKKDFHLLKNPKLVGEFNKYNLLAGIKCLNTLLNRDVTDIAMKFEGVKGRMERVNKNIIIDFAHTPDGMKKVLSAIKGEKIVVFGAGGDRDKSKRVLMGEIADKYASKIIITNDNPRSEEPILIANDISKGIKNSDFEIILDRKEAIKKAITQLKENQNLMILGKGDEKFIQIGNEKIEFNDRITVEKILKKL